MGAVRHRQGPEGPARESLPLYTAPSIKKGRQINMDVQTITTIIGTLGFPIAACIALFWKLEQEQEIHKQEVDKLAEVINDMKNVMTELSAYIKTMSGR